VIGKEALDYINAIVFAFYREVISGPALVLIAIIIEGNHPQTSERE
jgi:hypothetical protein